MALYSQILWAPPPRRVTSESTLCQPTIVGQLGLAAFGSLLGPQTEVRHLVGSRGSPRAQRMPRRLALVMARREFGANLDAVFSGK